MDLLDPLVNLGKEDLQDQLENEEKPERLDQEDLQVQEDVSTNHILGIEQILKSSDVSNNINIQY